MQTQGSLQEADLASLLETMQVERATGTLAVDDGSGTSASLFFLFGHLFHASDANRQGEDVVLDALSWNQGNFKFDPRAKLPAEETIKSSNEQMIAESRKRTADSGGAPDAPAELASEPEVAEQPAPTPSTAPELEAPGGAGLGEVTPAAAESYPAPEQSSVESSNGQADSGPPGALESIASPPWHQPAPEIKAAPEVAERVRHSRTPSPVATFAKATEPAAVASGGAISPTLTMYPFPSGSKTYEGLKSAFVDFPKLLRTLRSDTHTGYVHLHGANYSGTLLMETGQVLDAVSSENGGVLQGEPAFAQFRRHMDEGSGMLDVIELSNETVHAIAQLYSSPYLFIGLLGRFVNFNDLIEHLNEEKVSGAVVVHSAGSTGVILIRDGVVVGAFTDSAPELDTNLGKVSELAANQASRIDVKSGEGQPSGFDLDAALARPV